MASFPLCPDCNQEYHNVQDRRFHAQPIACHTCGPQVWLEQSDGRPIHASVFSQLDKMDTCCTLLQRGKILAIKGLGGFHLACDATDSAAVEKLRQRKHRLHKPFALMARDLEMIQTYCQVSDHERMLLESPVAPIVLLSRRNSTEPGIEPITKPIADAVAPDQTRIGFMLPYTPLHHLILKQMDRPIVLTSGNLSDQPQCIENDDARQKLAGITDYFLFHNRDIVNRLDDSVVRIVDTQVQILRRARGYVPASIRLPAGFQSAPALLAMGSELKNTFCLVRDGQAILSQHLGDLADATALAAYQQTLQLYLQLYQHQPTVIAIDLHPEYLSSKLGQELATAEGLTIELIQHHHAHIAACMAENGLPLSTQPVLGIAWDGLGYGEAGQLWGGEFLLADYRQFHRLASLKPVAMLGGEQTIYQPWRNTYAHLQAAGYRFTDSSATPSTCELLDYLQQKPHILLQQMLSQGLNSPLASSGGRLFDAVAAAVGLYRETCSYEGQGAIALETIAKEYLQTQPLQALSPEFAYPFAITCSSQGLLQLEPAPMWAALLADLAQSVPSAAIAARFHLGLAAGICDIASQLHQSYDFSEVVLSGGVWQNQLLWRQVSERLQQSGFKVFSHHQVPTNDGGLALGQGVIASARALYPLPSSEST
jgi:hydrogenase maturation protein HypF